MSGRRTWVAAIACALCACDARTTQLVVALDSDLRVPDELASVELRAWSPGQEPIAVTFGDVDRPLAMPFTLGVAPRQGTPEVSVEVIGRDARGAELVHRAAHTRFVAGRALLLPMPLARACAGARACEGAEETCADGACVSAEVDPALLAEAALGGPPPQLLEPSEPNDAGAHDDAGCIADAPCDTGEPCEVGASRCEPPACVVARRLAAGEACGEGRICSADGVCGGAS